MSSHRNRSWNETVVSAAGLLLVQAAWWLINSVGHHLAITWR